MSNKEPSGWSCAFAVSVVAICLTIAVIKGCEIGSEENIKRFEIQKRAEAEKK